MTIRESIKKAEDKLNKAGIHDAPNDARELMSFVTGLDRTGLIMYTNSELEPSNAAEYEELVNKRASRIPLQHITGEQEFMGYRFKVTKDVLSPRLETELLVREAAEHAILGARILDLCTGSGIIGIALKKICFASDVVMSDISDKALEVAAFNAKENKADVKIIKSDMFEGLKDEKPFNMIVSNPPYIPSKAIEELEPEVKDHDPMLALSGGEDGLDFYRKIALEAPKHLLPKGELLMEIGYDQGDDVTKILTESGAFENIEIMKDLAGNDRVAYARLI